jgi:hypothetical protein
MDASLGGLSRRVYEIENGGRLALGESRPSRLGIATR